MLWLLCNKMMVYLFSFCRHNFSDFVKPVSSKGMSIEEIHLTEDELELYLDLAPFLNPSPYIVPEDMSLAKVNEICFSSFWKVISFLFIYHLW